jgi:hypothetical protein
MRRSLSVQRGVLAFVVGLMMFGLAAAGQDHKSKRSQLMRQKLEFSKGILEGLTREDYQLVTKNARALKILSEAAEWEVPSIPNVEQYVPLTTEFQRLCDELGKKSKAKNIDGATLVYMQLTMNCVTCHKNVRGAKE